MPKPACIPCGRFFRPHKNGARLLEYMPTAGNAASGIEHRESWSPYKLWMCDVWRCDGCGTTMAVGYAGRPLAEHYQKNFADEVSHSDIAMNNALPRIYDC